ncbi:MAG: BlaI/MecI/CopY family transcriptional regulator [Bacteroidota bacterium]
MDNLSNFQPTDAELEILQVLWEHQPCTVRFIHEQLEAQGRNLAYTTILKTVQRMGEPTKGLVTRYKEGKTHYYSAIPKEADIQQSLLQRLKNTAFRGSAANLILHALGQEKPSSEELDQIRQFLEQKRKEM